MPVIRILKPRSKIVDYILRNVVLYNLIRRTCTSEFLNASIVLFARKCREAAVQYDFIAVRKRTYDETEKSVRSAARILKNE